MNQHRGVLRVLLIALVALILGTGAPGVWADDDDDNDEEIPFDEAHLFFELNDTDGDLGIHALIDGEPWKKLVIEDPRGRKMLNVRVKGRLQKQGLTEFFFESAEPIFDELAPADFFERFPEGEYEIEGQTLEGEELESEVELSHVMPAPPEPTVNDRPTVEVCDPTDLDFDAGTLEVEVDSVDSPVTIAWPEVTTSHPTIGTPDVEVEIHNYQLVVEGDSELSVILPPEVTSFTIPGGFIPLNEQIKYEVLVREENFNQTATESCFKLMLPSVP